jgi:hypothetical protein
MAHISVRTAILDRFPSADLGGDFHCADSHRLSRTSRYVDPLTRKGFPEIKEVIVFDAGKTGRRLIRQRTEKPGAILPIIAGTYDVECKTADGSEFVLVKNIPVRAQSRIPLLLSNRAPMMLWRKQAAGEPSLCSEAFGAIIGKALSPLSSGCGLIPILVTLQ